MSKTFKATRGGSWHTGDAACLAARARFRYAPSKRDFYLGFRCVRAKFSGSLRVFRGGSWLYGAAYCRAANRIVHGPEDRGGDLGFRCVRREK